LEEHIASIFRVEEIGSENQQASMWLATRLLAEPFPSTLKMEAICSSETSVESQRTTWHHIPEDDTLKKFDCSARVYCPPATGLCAVPFTR
jgi:hypothetical protein